MISNQSFKILAAAAGLISVPGLSAAQEYVVQPGDTLMGIANAELGSSTRWRTICDLNADVIIDCDRILPGTVLRLSEAIVRSEPAGPARAPVAEAAPESFATVVSLLAATSTEGAVPGALGAEGALPLGWRLGFWGEAEGIAEVVAVTEEYVDLRITQTGEGGAVSLQFRSPDGTYFPAEAGQEFWFSVDLALIDGALGTNDIPRLGGTERSETGSTLRSVAFESVVDLSLDLAGFGGTATVEDAEVRFINPDFRIISLGSWEAMFRIGVPEFSVLLK